MVLAALLDLVLPLPCAGCGGPGPRGLCAQCAALLGGPPFEARPTPAPVGLPTCLSGGVYAGPVREIILGYKERGRRSLSTPLGDRLAAVVRAGWPGSGPLALVPVPGTSAANRARHGDHMLRLALRCADTLGVAGMDATVERPLRARPRTDSTHLDRAARWAAAYAAFELRERPSATLATVADAGAVVLLDDILTTGSTLAATAAHLAAAGVPVAFAATIASTRLRGAGAAEGVAHP